MENIEIGARNNLNVPIRLTLTKAGYNDDTTKILIVIGNKGVALKSYYSVCIDTDLPPNQEWEDIGSMCIDAKCTLSIKGKTEV